MNDTLWLLMLLFTKHFVVDFPLQNRFQYANKGTYLHPGGLLHASLHGLTTMICVWFFGPMASVFLGWIDGIVHYHIDWAKMNWGNRDIQNPKFWNHLGLDQMAHQLTYIIFMAWMFSLTCPEFISLA